jgi:Fe2+ transport system protein FeoA
VKTDVLTLDQLKPGQSAIVANLSATGLNRRRMLDLGILPGTKVEVELVSPLGDPVAYRVRGSVVALRREQAREIEVTPQPREE